ncbi:MAG: transporter, partial [Bacteroidales bacterium]|nr:transporter [Bacteroidales bacterium]
YGCRISAGQALGQKNTVFEIWMGYTFMDPVTSVAGGFYSIWHNCFNTWQLYRRRKSLEASSQ